MRSFVVFRVLQRVALNTGPVRSDSGLILTAGYCLLEITEADVLLIPGAGNATMLRKYPEILAWIQSIHATTTWTTSVCYWQLNFRSSLPEFEDIEMGLDFVSDYGLNQVVGELA